MFLKGSSSNWAACLDFYQFDPDFLQQTAQLIGSRSDMECTIVDTSMYVTMNGQELETSIGRVDIWAEYQTSIGNQVRS